MLELKPKEPEFYSDHHILPQEYSMLIDGVVLEKVRVTEYTAKRDRPSLTISCFDRKISKVVADQLVMNSIKNIDNIHLEFNFEWGDGGSVLVDLEDNTITFHSSPDLGKWDKPFGFDDYCTKFIEMSRYSACQPAVVKTFKDDNHYTSSFSISMPYSAAKHLPLMTDISEYSEIAKEIHLNTTKALIDDALKNTFTVHFDFPEEIKVACEQYLVYFVQFLQDLGIKASHQLSHNGSETLFSVTSLQKDEALDNLRLALEAYLKLPSSPVSYGGENDICIQRLIANISHLQGQLALAQAVIQAKDATIHAQSVTINHQQQLIGGALLQPLRNGHNSKSFLQDKEELVGDILSVTKYQGRGFEINLPEIIRRLKRVLNTSKEK
jgi:hypothetical protein